MRLLASVAVFAVLLFAGYWFGESGAGPFVAVPWLAGLLLVVLGVFAMGSGWYVRAALVPLLAGLYLGAWALGAAGFQRAYNECAGAGEQVRGLLAEFHQAAGRYPATLGELPAPLPCARPLRGSILQYETTAGGYRLRFGDRLTAHSADETQAFTAQKK